MTPQRCPSHPPTHGLWNLWDMLNLNAKSLLDAYNIICVFGQTMEMQIAQGRNSNFPPSFISELKEKASSLADQCESLGLIASAGAARDVDEWIGKMMAVGEGNIVPPEIMARIRGYVREVQTTLRREAESRRFLVIAPEKQKFYEPAAPLFGSDVATKFPSIIADISEAGKCLALGRSTASAFHSIRCLEAGIRAIARCLNIADPTRARERTWGKVLSAIKDEVDRRWPFANQRMMGDGELFSGLYGSLAAIQNPYRDSTMHLVTNFSDEDASYVFEMVRGLMTRIAAKMDEDGEPKV